MITPRTEALARRLANVQVIPATAFDASGGVALETMQRHWEQLVEAGIRVFVPGAGSAEFHSLTDEELLAVIRAARRTLGDSITLVAPIGRALKSAQRLAAECLEAGADALLVMPLDFPYLSDTGARRYYEALLDSVEAPLLIYKKDDIPSHDLLLALSDHPWLVGVKYAQPDVAGFQRIVEQDAGRSAWYCGLAERYAPYFHLAGAASYTSGAGNICPRITLKLFQALLEGNWNEALRWQRALLPIEYHRAQEKNSYNVTTLKYALRHLGLDFGPPRPPQRCLTDSEIAKLDELLDPILKLEKELAAQV
ncbi:MAG: putative 5-dehydro-4-deoxyglucarate dehydratase 2 [Pirellulaceae bacterium]|nr:MAG: putative 5-dehydro-4-deoxyglucarate dehydratase 2 [Pirellulaceae bacterium]